MSTPTSNPFAGPGQAPTPQTSAPAAPPQAQAPAAAPLPTDVQPGGFQSFYELDLSDIESSGLITGGAYPMVLDKIEFGRSKAGNDKLVWKFRIIDNANYGGRVLQLHTAITPDALWKIRQVSDALGQPPKFTPGDHLIGTVVTGVVVDDEYEGRKRSALQEVMPPDPRYGPPGSKYTG